MLTDRSPDYVVLGEPDLLVRGDHHRDPADPGRLPVRVHQPRSDRPERAGVLPAAGAVAALIEKATGRTPYFVGKPNPLMMRSAMRAIGAHSRAP